MNQDDKKTLPELAKEKAARARKHLKDNRKVYFASGGGVVVGASVATAIALHRFGRFPIGISQTAKNTALIVWKPEITQVALVKKACPDPIPVRDLLTGMDYPSISEAVRKTGTTFASITKDAQGHQSRWLRLPDSVFA